jgi:hypothetical protein
MSQASTDTSRSTPDIETKTPLWEFVHPDEYDVPKAHMQETAVGTWRSIRQIFRRKDVSSTPFKNEDELRAMSRLRLAHLAPPLPWEDAAVALDLALGDWMDEESSGESVRFFIGQPFAGHAEILSHAGRKHHAAVIPPPSPEQILSDDEGWLHDWPSSGKFWILPNLEHCYLRHARGLDLVRRLLSLSADGRLGKGMIGCGSWAWACLRRIIPMPPGDAVTLQAFDADRLHHLLYGLMNSRSSKQIRCYNADNGEEIPEAPPEGGQQRKEFVELAAHCRGNAALAAAYWRKRLRFRPYEENAPDSTSAEEAAGEPLADEAVWVSGMPTDPDLPSENTEELLLLLHAMLLHGGLPEHLAATLLPFSETRCRILLSRLHQAGLARLAHGRWQVREAAYASVRRSLSGRDYLTDSF